MPNTKNIVSVADDKTIKVHNYETGELIHDLVDDK